MQNYEVYITNMYAQAAIVWYFLMYDNVASGIILTKCKVNFAKRFYS